MIGNLGMGEILLIAGIALVVLGPEKFPEYAKIAMRAFRDMRGYVDEVKREMAEELRPIKKEIQELSRHNPEDYIDSITDAVTSVDDDDEEDVDGEDAGPSYDKTGQSAVTEPRTDAPADQEGEGAYEDDYEQDESWGADYEPSAGYDHAADGDPEVAATDEAGSVEETPERLDG